MNVLLQEECKRNLAAAILRSSGTLQLRATGTSMLPTLWPGDCLTIQSYNFEDAETGDLVLYARGGRLFVHRVMRKCRLGETHSLITRGDCMTEEDPPVEENDLLGKVIGDPSARLADHACTEAVSIPAAGCMAALPLEFCAPGHASNIRKPRFRMVVDRVDGVILGRRPKKRT